MSYDTETCEYVEKRLSEGKIDKEIRRYVKCYLARRVFRIPTAVAQAKKSQAETLQEIEESTVEDTPD